GSATAASATSPRAGRSSRRRRDSRSSSRRARGCSRSRPARRSSTRSRASPPTTRGSAPPRVASARSPWARRRCSGASSPTRGSAERAMRVVVTGLVATYPVGGVAWDYLQYVQGFHALGCEVWYVEDTGRWLYDPERETFVADATRGARFVGESLPWLDPALARPWAGRAPGGRG